MNKYDERETINIGSGTDMTIEELIKLIVEEFNYSGEVIYDKSKPDGTMLKLLDNSKIQSYGWLPKINIREGIKRIVEQAESLNLI